MTAPDRSERTLPLQLTTFVGRRGEIMEARALLGSTRLLTLTGAGGTGKTRLAVEVARGLADDEGEDVVWVELGALTDADLVPHQVAAAVGMGEQDEGSITDALVGVLARRSPVLVLDNCEHLVDGCAAMVDVLLRGAPGLRVLATSREPLGVAGERAWLVPPLSVPGPEDGPSPELLLQSEAVQLFRARARDARRDFEVTAENVAPVAEICRRLDGIPLAIELAAARTRMLSPEQIAERLDQLFDLLSTGSRTALPRHRTLRATLDWSYDLLSDPERVLLQRLSVFSGGFTLESVEEVCAGNEVGEEAVLDLLASLVDRSVVVVRESGGRTRYHLLEAVRRYAEERLRDDERVDIDGLRRRHAERFLRLAEDAHAAMEGYQRLHIWFPRLRGEQDNLRAALGWSLAADPGTAVRLAGALVYLWTPQPVHWAEGLRWMEAALEGARDQGPPGPRCRACWGAGILAFLTHDWPRARRRLDEARLLAAEACDRPSLILALGFLAFVTAAEGELEAALVHGEEAVRLAREVGEPWRLVLALVTGLAVPRGMGEGPEAMEPFLQEALELSRREDYAWGIWESAMRLAHLSLHRGEVEDAHRLAVLAAEASSAVGPDWHAARALMTLARTVAALGHPGRAARLVGAAEGWLDARGSRLLAGDDASYRALLGELTHSLGAEGLARERAAGRALDLTEAIRGETHGHARTGPGLAHPGPSGGVVPLEAPVDGPEPPAPGIRAQDHSATGGLRASALGPVVIEVGEAPLDADRWTHGKPVELLFYLLAHPAGRTRAQVGIDFWPDASAAQVKNNFHVLLHKVRKALGSSDLIVLEGERYRIAPTVETWFDVDVFEREMRDLLRKGGAGASAARLEGALALYRGDFLEGLPVGDWHLELHDRLRRLYVDGLSLLADLKIEAGDDAGAVAALERLAHAEPLHEGACRSLMTCLVRIGRRDRALQHYSRLRALLDDELGLEPEARTSELADQIRGGAPA